MGDDTLTHKDLSGMLGVSQTTIKNYRRKFPGLIPLATLGKPLRFKEEAAEICRLIRDGFAHGLSSSEIREKILVEHGGLAAGTGGGGAGGFETLSGILETLSARVEEIIRGQSEISKRLDEIEESAETRIDPELLDELLSPVLERLDGLAGTTEEQGGQGRVVRIRAKDGTYQRYELKHLKTEPESEEAMTSPDSEKGTSGRAAETPEHQPREADDFMDDSNEPMPPSEFFTLPMVIRSERGEFLGVPGRTEGHLSIEDFLALLERQIRTPGNLPVHWRNHGNSWIMHVELGKPPYRKDHVMELNRMTTPRGNRVAWLKSMRIGEELVPDSFLANFLKQLRKELTA